MSQEIATEKTSILRTQYRRGAKAGLIAGLVHGMIVGIPLYLIWQSGSFYDFIANGIRNSLPTWTANDVNDLISFSLFMILLAIVVGGMFGGTILGLMYAGIRDLDEKKHVRPIPSWIFGAVFFGVELGIIVLSSQFHFGTTYGESVILISLIASMVFGYLLGYFFQRFTPQQSRLSAVQTLAASRNGV